MDLKGRNRIRVLVTGCDGQLGKCIQVLVKNNLKVTFFFTNSKKLDITRKNKIGDYFVNKDLDYVINCAAYTNVEQAEKESEIALLVNGDGVRNLAEVCKRCKTTLIHISTDYVFDGRKKLPYTEEDVPNPINKYGISKLKGEQYVQEILDEHFIIRTSWLYSQFGKNFYKTILKKSQTEKQLTITTSEIGTPTNANDLAKFILYLITSGSDKYGIYHFSNEGKATWYDFAKEILSNISEVENINLIKTDDYPTFAKRPKYSVLNKGKAIKVLNYNILNWKNSLRNLHS